MIEWCSIILFANMIVAKPNPIQTDSDMNSISQMRQLMSRLHRMHNQRNNPMFSILINQIGIDPVSVKKKTPEIDRKEIEKNELDQPLFVYFHDNLISLHVFVMFHSMP